MTYLLTELVIYLICTATSHATLPSSNESGRASSWPSDDNYDGTMGAVTSRNFVLLEEGNQEPDESKTEQSDEEIKVTDSDRVYVDSINHVKVQEEDLRDLEEEEIEGAKSMVAYSGDRMANRLTGSTPNPRRSKLANAVKGMINKIKQKSKLKVKTDGNRGKNKTFVSQARSVPPRNYSIVQNLRQFGLDDQLAESFDGRLSQTPLTVSENQMVNSKIKYGSKNERRPSNREHGSQGRTLDSNVLGRVSQSSKQSDSPGIKSTQVAGNQFIMSNKIKNDSITSKTKAITSNRMSSNSLRNLSHNSSPNSKLKKTIILSRYVKKMPKKVEGDHELDHKEKAILRKTVCKKVNYFEFPQFKLKSERMSKLNRNKIKGRVVRKKMRNQSRKFVNATSGIFSHPKRDWKETSTVPFRTSTNALRDSVSLAHEVPNITSSTSNKALATLVSVGCQPYNNSLDENKATTDIYRHNNKAVSDATDKDKYISTQSSLFSNHDKTLPTDVHTNFYNKIDEKTENLNEITKFLSEKINKESLGENTTVVEVTRGSNEMFETEPVENSKHENFNKLEAEKQKVNLEVQETNRPLNKEVNRNRGNNGKLRKSPRRRLPGGKKRSEVGGKGGPHHGHTEPGGRGGFHRGCTPSQSLLNWLNPWAKISNDLSQ